MCGKSGCRLIRNSAGPALHSSSKTNTVGVPFMAQQATNAAGIHEDAGSIPGLALQVRDPALLWLWCRLTVAAPIGPLAWELPYARGAALKSKKTQKTKKPTKVIY